MKLDAGDPFPIRLVVRNTTPEVRDAYRGLRRAGMERRDVNLICFGGCLYAPIGDAVVLRCKREDG
jgi:hypothetical protein